MCRVVNIYLKTIKSAGRNKRAELSFPKAVRNSQAKNMSNEQAEWTKL